MVDKPFTKVAPDNNELPPSDAAQQSAAAAPPTPRRGKREEPRTKGEYVFDAFLYPFLNNIVVFGISVVATYLTSHGDKMGGGVGKWFFERGEKFKKFARKTGMSEGQADMAKMVTFSFLDGSIMAPFVKMFEDRREKIARALDKRMGTEPEDESVYAQEPKQSWKSVLLGRAATVSIVVPTAVGLEKMGLNDVMFTKPGKRLGKWFVKNHPGVQKRYPHLDIPELFKVGTFEAFYTSVCTGGIYFWSRMIARMHNNKEARKEEKAQPPPPTIPVPTSDDSTPSTNGASSFAAKYTNGKGYVPVEPRTDNYVEQIIQDKTASKEPQPHAV